LYTVGWCDHHLFVGFSLCGLHLGHMLILTKIFDSAPVHPPSGRLPRSFRNDVVDDIGWMLMWHDLIRC
jgi:hypothetical protein